MAATWRRVVPIAIKFPTEAAEACAQLVLGDHRLLSGEAMGGQTQAISRRAQRVDAFEQRTPIDGRRTSAACHDASMSSAKIAATLSPGRMRTTG